MRHLDPDLVLVLWMRHLDFDLAFVLWMRHLDIDFDRVLWMRKNQHKHPNSRKLRVPRNVFRLNISLRGTGTLT